MSLYGAAVKRPIMTTLCFVAVVILGLFSLVKLPIDLLPDIETNTIMVITMYPGASAEDIEQNVTKPLENTLNSVEHLKHISSNSKENISIVTLEFEYGYDIDEALASDVMIFSPANFFDMNMSTDERCRELSRSSMVVYLDIDEDTRRERLSVRYNGGKEDDSLERRLRADAEDFRTLDHIDWKNSSLEDFVHLCNKDEVDDFLKKLFS